MKKLVSLMSAAVLVFGLAVPSYAAPAKKIEMKTKEVGVILTAPTEEVEIGQLVNLSASTIKHGQIKHDEWTLAEKTGTTLNVETGEYISNATFVANEPGTYEIEYSIRMEAGKSGISFVGKEGTTVTYVENEVVVVQKITIKVKSVTMNFSGGKTPQLVNHTVLADVTTELSNGDTHTTEIEFEINKFSKPEDVTYTYTNEDFEISETVIFEDMMNIVGQTKEIEFE